MPNENRGYAIEQCVSERNRAEAKVRMLQGAATALREENAKLRLDLSVAKHEAQMAKDAVRLREADVAALRDGLHNVIGIDKSDGWTYALAHDGVSKLLASPNTGAGIMRVVEAAVALHKRLTVFIQEGPRQFGNDLDMQAVDAVDKAVRDLDAPRAEQPEEKEGSGKRPSAKAEGL